MRSLITLAALLAVAEAQSSNGSLPNATDPLTVDVGYGKYRGFEDAGTRKWYGVRFAAPPTGQNRFRDPQDPEPFDGVQDATKFGAICPPQQSTDYTLSGQSDRFVVDEDCLFLSVTAPTSTTDLKPVHVFIQGGGFSSNSNSNYNASDVVTDAEIVSVQFNYRVGMTGFLFSEEAVADGSPNAGIKDMIKCLEWIQEHISKFGGDPSRVTIDGVSAGGSAVALLLAANKGALGGTLFHGGIVESGGWATMRKVEQGQKEYDCLTAQTGCNGTDNSLACLRETALEDLYSSSCWFGPNLDNDLFSDRLVEMYEAGDVADVPTIMGACANEGTLYSFDSSANTTEAFDSYFTGQVPTLTNSSLAILNDLYAYQPAPKFPDSGSLYRQGANAIADLGTHCPIKFMQNALAAKGTPTYNYKYAVRDAENEAKGLGAWHVVNNYAFYGVNSTDMSAPTSYVDGSRNAALKQARDYWTSFVRNLDPNTDRSSGAPEWNAWSGPGADARERLVINTQTNATRVEHMTDAQSLRCDAARNFTLGLGAGWPNDLKDPANAINIDAGLAKQALEATDCGFDEGCRAPDCTIIPPTSGHFPEQVANAEFVCPAASSLVASKSRRSRRAFVA
ncbi:hypothetical protein J7T55_015003 [Diaporthe amygdali]|uniref:uncharacterized protein n=1 Tax=Phomopsis amygdali TaxID=1214568 RepID=UPI0022FDD3A4|nr:uncharacterized protein J7T55_015003 [Diaporthe amygdali]KAJ0108569.1 hypothetical protein J7T55_015003 [Diaporthe amygdali]